MNLSALARPGARRRWGVATGAVAVLCALPAVIGAVPVHVKAQSTAMTLQRIEASAATPYSGYAESVGRLLLPDVGQFADVLDLLGTTSRLRVWWDTPTHYRVDTVATGGEKDVHVDGIRTWNWDSSRRQAVIQHGDPALPVPAAPDATPPSLVRRLLADVQAKDVTPGKAERIAGRDARGLVVHVTDPQSLVGTVNVWADASTGLPLKAEIYARGATAAAFSTSFLDVKLARPAARDIAFSPRRDPTARVQFVGRRDGRQPGSAFQLPDSIAGLAVRSDPEPYVATYGRGFALVAVVPVPQGTAAAIRDKADSPSRPAVTEPWGEASLVTTPLVTGLAVATADRGYLLAGTVPRAVLEAVATELVEHPPPATPGGSR